MNWHGTPVFASLPGDGHESYPLLVARNKSEKNVAGEALFDYFDSLKEAENLKIEWAPHRTLLVILF